MKKLILIILLPIFLMLSSCGGGGGGSTAELDGGGDTVTESGTVALFVTDSLSDFKQVVATISGVDILNTGTEVSCSILSDAVTLDIAELSSEFLLLDITSCPADAYNRIRVEINNSVTLMDKDDTTDTCTFVSYKDAQNQPNVLQCIGDTCQIEINGMVNVVAKQSNTITLDFDLKEFEVEDFGGPECTVTMKVEPLNNNDIEDRKSKGHKETIKGYVSDLNPDAQTFILTKKEHTFSVYYSDVTQPGIDELLQLAQDYELKTKVHCSDFDVESNVCTASEIQVNVEGTVSELTDDTFTLTFNPSICINYTEALVEGDLVDGAEAEVGLSGFEGECYLAHKVEAEEDDEKDDKKKKEEEIKGYVSDLNTDAQTFILTKEEHIYAVHYSDVTQPGIDELLLLARDYGLWTEIHCSDFDVESLTCTASEIHVEAKGTVSDLTDDTFTLTFNPSICINYSEAVVKGDLVDGAEAEVGLSGFEGECYLAHKVEAEEEHEK